MHGFFFDDRKKIEETDFMSLKKGLIEAIFSSLMLMFFKFLQRVLEYIYDS